MIINSSTFFMSISAFLIGFHTLIRLVVAIDGIFFKVLRDFVPTCKNDNNQIYPLSFGIGDLKNNASWEWFLTKLLDAIGHIDNLFMISY